MDNGDDDHDHNEDDDVDAGDDDDDNADDDDDDNDDDDDDDDNDDNNDGSDDDEDDDDNYDDDADDEEDGGGGDDDGDDDDDDDEDEDGSDNDNDNDDDDDGDDDHCYDSDDHMNFPRPQQDIFQLQKERMNLATQRLYDAEFSKGRTKAVLDAAGKALSLIDRDSTIGIEASRAVKRFGVKNLLRINSICFQVPVESLASSCVDMNINATILNKTENVSLPFHGCLNKQLVPRLARYLANNVFPDVSGGKAKRSLLSEETGFINRAGVTGDEEDLSRRARSTEEREGGVHPADKIEPFWEIIHQHDPLDEIPKAQPSTHSSLGSFKRKWKIPGKLCRLEAEQCQFNLFTPKSVQFQISPAPPIKILHHTVWRTGFS